MRKMLFFLLLSSPLYMLAQDKFVPAIKQGAKLQYVVQVNGQDIPLYITFDSAATDFLRFNWSIEGMGSGKWIMKSKSLESATRTYWNQPNPDTEEVLPDDQVVLILPRSVWKSIQQDKKAMLDNQNFQVKEATEKQQFKLAGKVVDAVYMESGSTHYWILNDANFPIILRIEGNMAGYDLLLQSAQ
ncbi:MAG: hypothetical protein QM731_19395 [Chitinophagaceae bacterium]